MDSIQLLNSIQIQLDEMSSFNKQLLANGNQLSILDIELLKQKCTAVYESAIKLKPDIHNTSEPVLEMKKDEAEPVISVVEEEKTITIQPIIEDAVAVPEMHSLIIEETQVTETVITPEVIPPTPTLFTEPAPVVEKKEATFTFSHNELSLHEKIAHTKQPDLKERFSEAKVESLKAAINLNKKIAFVNELFKENTVEYAKAIDKLNMSADANEALRYFNELKHHYSWSNDNELVIELEQLIQKRFR